TRDNGAFGPPDAARLNPEGKVPTMSFDGLAMTESVACLLHIADLYPEARLAPAAGTPERGQYYRWLADLLSPVQAAFYGSIYPARYAPASAEGAVRAHAVEELERYRMMLDAHLVASGPYLLGELFTAADLFLFMLTRWGRRLERRWWDAPALGDHYRVVKARPAVQRVFEQERLDDEA